MQNRYASFSTLVICSLIIVRCNNYQYKKDIHSWKGHYEMSAVSDEIMNNLEVGTIYKLDISKDSCLFNGDGIQYAFNAQCTVKASKDTLFGYFCYDTRGRRQYWNPEVPLFKIFKKDTSYYIISSAILEDTTKTYLLKHTPESEKIQ